MTMLRVKVRTEMYLDEVDATKGYVMKGIKGDFILARNKAGKFSFVRLTPGKVTKPVNEYDTVQDAIKDKLDRGYEVYQFEKAELS